MFAEFVNAPDRSSNDSNSNEKRTKGRRRPLLFSEERKTHSSCSVLPIFPPFAFSSSLPCLSEAFTVARGSPWRAPRPFGAEQRAKRGRDRGQKGNQLNRRRQRLDRGTAVTLLASRPHVRGSRAPLGESDRVAVCSGALSC